MFRNNNNPGETLVKICPFVLNHQGNPCLHRRRPPRLPHLCNWTTAKRKVRTLYYIFSPEKYEKQFTLLFASYRIKNILSEKVHLMCYRICVRALTAIITYHDR